MFPVLFSLPFGEAPTPVASYGFLIAVALVLGWVLSLRFARLDKLPADQLGTAYVLSVGAGLLAARAMWMRQHPDPSADWTAYITPAAGGLVGFAGILVGLVVAASFCQNRKQPIPAWAWLDCIAPAFMIGVVLERVGAFLAGANFGHYVEPDFALAVSFPAESLVYAVQQRELTGIQIPAETSLSVHPVQLYAAILCAVGAALTFVIRSRRQYSGQVALFVLGYYGVVRYLIEDPFRHDASLSLFKSISLGHVTGIVALGLVIAAHFSRMQKLQEQPEAVIQWTGGPWDPNAPKKKKKGKKKKKKSDKSGAKSDKKSKPKADEKA